MVLTRAQLEAVARHAEASAPEECCGVLIGRPGADGAEVTEVVAAPNVAEGDRRLRYAIEVRSLLDSYKRARERGLEVVGYYHSHPEAEARPSAHDLEHALPGVSYLIVALRAGRVSEARVWRLAGDRFEEENLGPSLGQGASR